MEDKRGQVTVFVVIAIIIVAALLLFVFLYTQGLIMPLSDEESQQILGSQIEPLRNYVSSCVEIASLSALEHLGEHAGYADFRENGLSSINFAGEKVIVVIKTEKGFVNRLPSKQEFERQFAIYMDDKDRGKKQLDNCIGDFDSFKAQGFSVSPKRRKITINIVPEIINVEVDWTIDLMKGRARIPVEQKNVIIISEVERTLRAVNDIVNKEASGIAFEGVEFDKYVVENPFILSNIDLTSQNYPTFNQKIFMLTAIPKKPQEKEFRFYFAIDRSIP